jgi:succinate-semialdehyde dehydrogenase / glutarate-semialdehyde dehydrogenase
MAIASIDPTTDRIHAEFEPHSTQQIEERIIAAEATFVSLKSSTFAERASWMLAAADILEQEVEKVASMVTGEMGKTLATARYEILKSATGMRQHQNCMAVLRRRSGPQEASE